MDLTINTVTYIISGYNVTILAYGQTGSGKTYTMGTNYSGSDGDSTKLGKISFVYNNNSISGGPKLFLAEVKRGCLV